MSLVSHTVQYRSGSPFRGPDFVEATHDYHSRQKDQINFRKKIKFIRKKNMSFYAQPGLDTDFHQHETTRFDQRVPLHATENLRKEPRDFKDIHAYDADIVKSTRNNNATLTSTFNSKTNESRWSNHEFERPHTTSSLSRTSLLNDNSGNNIGTNSKLLQRPQTNQKMRREGGLDSSQNMFHNLETPSNTVLPKCVKGLNNTIYHPSQVSERLPEHYLPPSILKKADSPSKYLKVANEIELISKYGELPKGKPQPPTEEEKKQDFRLNLMMGALDEKAKQKMLAEQQAIALMNSKVITEDSIIRGKVEARQEHSSGKRMALANLMTKNIKRFHEIVKLSKEKGVSSDKIVVLVVKSDSKLNDVLEKRSKNSKKEKEGEPQSQDKHSNEKLDRKSENLSKSSNVETTKTTASITPSTSSSSSSSTLPTTNSNRPSSAPGKRRNIDPSHDPSWFDKRVFEKDLERPPPQIDMGSHFGTGKSAPPVPFTPTLNSKSQVNIIVDEHGEIRKVILKSSTVKPRPKSARSSKKKHMDSVVSAAASEEEEGGDERERDGDVKAKQILKEMTKERRDKFLLKESDEKTQSRSAHKKELIRERNRLLAGSKTSKAHRDYINANSENEKISEEYGIDRSSLSNRLDPRMMAPGFDIEAADRRRMKTVHRNRRLYKRIVDKQIKLTTAITDAAALKDIAFIPREIEMSRLKLEKLCLEKIYKDHGGDTWFKKQNWLSDKPVSKWHGIVTDAEGYVVEIRLNNNNLKSLNGSLSIYFSYIKGLEFLDLDKNHLSGILAVSVLCHLNNLEVLSLRMNKLEGELPIRVLSVHVPRLREVWLSDNLFSGHIHKSIGDITNLTHFCAYKNRLSGELPVDIGRCEYLELFSVGRNGLTGPIPASFESNLNLVHLSLYANILSGKCPTFLGKLEKLKELNLFANNFDGFVPANVSEARKRVADLETASADNKTAAGLLSRTHDMLATGSSSASTQGGTGIDMFEFDMYTNVESVWEDDKEWNTLKEEELGLHLMEDDRVASIGKKLKKNTVKFSNS